MGAIGHPGDIERLRMAAIEVTSTEGFARSSYDVSLRRLANYSLSPALKAAFEQIYGPPYLARMLFVELGRDNAPNLYLRVEYDGSIHTNGGVFGRAVEPFGVISGTASSTAVMERYLREHNTSEQSLEAAVEVALNAWMIGQLALSEEAREEIPADDILLKQRHEYLGTASIEAAVLERGSPFQVTWRGLEDGTLRRVLLGGG
jgi:proteasome alpha subunit